MGCLLGTSYMDAEINMGYDSMFNSRQLNQVHSVCPSLVYTYHTQFFIHRQNSTRLTQALCLTLLFFCLLFFRFPPTRSIGREYRSLTSFHIQLEEKECIAWISFVLDYGFGLQPWGLMQFTFVFMLL